MTTPHQEDAIATMRDVLQDDFLTLQVLRSTATEDFAAGTCRLQAVVSAEPLAAEAEIDAQGVGVVAAFFDGLRARFAPEHPSLRSLSFSSFDVRGLIEESGDGDRSSPGLLEKTPEDTIFPLEFPEIGSSLRPPYFQRNFRKSLPDPTGHGGPPP